MHLNLLQINLTAYLTESICRLYLLWMPFIAASDYIFISRNKVIAFNPQVQNASLQQQLTALVVTKLHPGLHAPTSRGFAGLGRGKYRIEEGSRPGTVLFKLLWAWSTWRNIFYVTPSTHTHERPVPQTEYTLTSATHLVFSTLLYSSKNKIQLAVTLEIDFISC